MRAPNLAAAHDYVSKGWPVLPIVPGGKRPAISNGFLAAEADHDFVERQFSDPARGVGIRTGAASGLFVLDIDPRNGGDASLERLLETNGPLPTTLTVNTGGGGRHFYFQLPPGTALGCKAGLGGFPGIDVKGDGGYVVAPPSGHSSGGRYEWSTAAAADAPVEEAPGWLINLITNRQPASKQRPPQKLDLQASEGSRNPTIFALSRKLRDAGLSEKTAGEMACQASAGFSPPLGEAEVLRAVASAFTRSPADSLPFTDMANARRLVDKADGNYRYEPAARRWLMWTGKTWATDEDGAVIRVAREVLLDLEDRANELTDPDARSKAVTAARRQQSAPRLNAMVELARTEPECPVFAHRLDKHPLLLNVSNGVVDLRSGEIKPHDRELLLTRAVPFDYHADAECPRFLDFLEQVFEGDAELIGFVRRLLGYVTTADVSEQAFVICIGAGANGKSTLLNAISHVLGPFAGHTPSETLVSQKFGRSSSNDLARLKGLRLVTASEFNPGEKLATGLIKQLTGNESITARHLYREFEQFVPEFKIVLATNDMPHMDAADDAIFRRLIVVPFNRVFSKDQQDRSLGEKLKDEAPGILTWLVKGAVEWGRSGLRTPQSIRSIVDNIRREMDPVAQFLEEACVFGSTLELTSAALHAVFMSWAHRHGLAHTDSRNFGKIIAKKGYRSRKSNGRMVWQGLQLRPEFQVTHLMGDAA